jgi:hypothetical protein
MDGGSSPELRLGRGAEQMTVSIVSLSWDGG